MLLKVSPRWTVTCSTSQGSARAARLWSGAPPGRRGSAAQAVELQRARRRGRQQEGALGRRLQAVADRQLAEVAGRPGSIGRALRCRRAAGWSQAMAPLRGPAAPARAPGGLHSARPGPAPRRSGSGASAAGSSGTMATRVAIEPAPKPRRAKAIGERPQQDAPLPGTRHDSPRSLSDRLDAQTRPVP